jgi:glycerophosphoryl diester phosphodiesterase
LPFALVDAWRAPPPDPQVAGWLRDHVYAHRGLHSTQVCENSHAAFASAIEAGLGIECDVRRTADERAVVFHDATLDRLAGREGRLDRMAIGEVTQVPLTIGGELVPTLRDVLDQVAGQVPLLLELKVDRNRSVHRLCRAVRRDLEGYRGPLAVMSFDPRVGAWFASRAPHVLRGLVVTEENSRTFSGTVKRHMALWHARAQFLAYDVRDLPSTFAARQKKRGLPLLTWTVSSPSLRERALEYADAPIAEGPGLAKAAGQP